MPLFFRDAARRHRPSAIHANVNNSSVTYTKRCQAGPKKSSVVLGEKLGTPYGLPKKIIRCRLHCSIASVPNELDDDEDEDDVVRNNLALIILATARHCSHNNAKNAIFSAVLYPFLDVNAGLFRRMGGGGGVALDIDGAAGG